METSTNFINLVREFEGLSLVPYLCPAGIATIGYGTTVYPDNTKVTMKDPAITEQQASYYLQFSANSCINTINRALILDVNQNQFDALVDFVYNVGCGNFLSSTLLKKINLNPDDDSIENEFLKWCKAKVHGKLIRLPGLTRRRQAESDLYFKDM